MMPISIIPHPDHIARCPFCGGWPRFRQVTKEEFNSGNVAYFVRYSMECTDCHSIRYVLNSDVKRLGITENDMGIGIKNEKDLAVEVWNHRKESQ